MKNITFRFTALLIIALLATGVVFAANDKNKDKKPTEKPKGAVRLLKEKKLDNWVFKLKDNSVDPATVFTLHEGILHITGSPFGYMRTKEEYSDYKLHVEWRWPSEPSNSGVFIHAQAPDSIWLRCVECQLKAGSAGDFVCMNGADMTQRFDKTKPFVSKLAPSSEKPAGEWNTLEVNCKGNTIVVHVNGILQNKGTNVNLSKGSICLQSEGKDIEFRNVYLTKLKK
jgi:hypothetical protein